MIRFVRAHGLGNDYVVLELPEGFPALSPEAIRLICHRNLGLGSDGILLPSPTAEGIPGLRILNPDGSEAQKSGNGLRIFARYLFDRNRLPPDGRIHTAGGTVQARVISRPSGEPLLEVDMGRASFLTADLPMLAASSEAVEVPLEVPGFSLPGTAVSMGNPHWVTFVPDLTQVPLGDFGPAVENHPRFPERTNVQLAQVTSPHHVSVRIWERGAGHTLASGSSACAVAAAGLRTGRLQPEVTVHMEGGDLEILLDPHYNVRQRGPVCLVAEGTLSDSFVQAIRDLC